MIKIDGLTKKFESVTAVNNLDLEVHQGEIFGFLGPNGAGKTTTIKLLTGLLNPTKGDIHIDGKSLKNDPTGVKNIIGYIPDQPYLYQKLTGTEFIKFAARLYGIMDCQKEIDDLMSTFDLTFYKDLLIENYSHGMRQKIALAAALIHKPKVVLVDEPMVGLDPKSIRLVKDIFRSLSKNGTTIFMSTHTLDLAEDICSRMGIINSGKLIALGTIQELRVIAKTEELEDVFLMLTKPEMQDTI